MTQYSAYSFAEIRRIELEARRLRAEAMKDIFVALGRALAAPFRATAKLGGKPAADMA